MLWHRGIRTRAPYGAQCSFIPLTLPLDHLSFCYHMQNLAFYVYIATVISPVLMTSALIALRLYPMVAEARSKHSRSVISNNVTFYTNIIFLILLYYTAFFKCVFSQIHSLFVYVS